MFTGGQVYGWAGRFGLRVQIPRNFELYRYGEGISGDIRSLPVFKH